MDEFVKGRIPYLILPYDQSARCKHGNHFAAGVARDDWLVVKGSKKNPPVLITINAIRQVNVYYRPTVGSCDCKQLYDGNEDAILNVCDNFLITHKLFLDFETMLQYNRITINGYVQAWNAACRLYVNCYTMSVKLFNHAYCCFVQLCKPRIEENLFRCEKCEQAPRQTIVYDGIKMGSAT